MKDGETRLIRRIFKSKKGHKISRTQGIFYSRIKEDFKDYITDITTNPEKYRPIGVEKRSMVCRKSEKR